MIHRSNWLLMWSCHILLAMKTVWESGAYISTAFTCSEHPCLSCECIWCLIRSLLFPAVFWLFWFCGLCLYRYIYNMYICFGQFICQWMLASSSCSNMNAYLLERSVPFFGWTRQSATSMKNVAAKIKPHRNIGWHACHTYKLFTKTCTVTGGAKPV